MDQSKLGFFVKKLCFFRFCTPLFLNLRICYFILLLLLCYSSGTLAASFDCSKAKSAVENVICQNEELSALDMDLTRLYKSLCLIVEPDNVKSIQEDQRKWLKKRNQCETSSEIVKCVFDSYQIRIAYLKELLLKKSSAKEDLKPEESKTVKRVDSIKRPIDVNNYQVLLGYLMLEVCSWPDLEINDMFIVDIGLPIGEIIIVDFYCPGRPPSSGLIGFRLDKNGKFKIILPSLIYWEGCYRHCNEEDYPIPEFELFLYDINDDGFEEILLVTGDQDFFRSIGYENTWTSVDESLATHLEKKPGKRYSYINLNKFIDKELEKSTVDVIDPDTYFRPDNLLAKSRIQEITASNYKVLINGDGSRIVIDPCCAKTREKQVEIYQYDLMKHSISQISIPGAESSVDLYTASVSGNGRYLYFSSYKKLTIVNDKHNFHVYQYDMLTGAIDLISKESGSWKSKHNGKQIYNTVNSSFDGDLIVFEHYSDLNEMDKNSFQDIYLHNKKSRTNMLVSKEHINGVAYKGGYAPVISTDGHYITYLVYVPYAKYFLNNRTLISEGGFQIIIYDVLKDEYSNINLIKGLLPYHYNLRMSGNGKYVVYYSDFPDKSLVIYDISSKTWNMEKGLVVSSFEVSDTGRYITFIGTPTIERFISIEGKKGLYQLDRNTGIVRLIAKTIEGKIPIKEVLSFDVSDDGRLVLFSTEANDIVHGDQNNSLDVFLYDRADDTTVRISIFNKESIGSAEWINLFAIADTYLHEKNRKLQSKLDLFNSYLWEKNNNILRFYSTKYHGRSAFARVVWLGSYDKKKTQWQWNELIPLNDWIKDIKKSLSLKTSLPYFEEQTFDASEEISWEISGVVAQYKNAMGVYRIADADKFHYLLVSEYVESQRPH